MEDCVETVMQVDPGGAEHVAHGAAAGCELGQPRGAELAETGLNQADAGAGPEEANNGEAGAAARGGKGRMRGIGVLCECDASFVQ